METRHENRSVSCDYAPKIVKSTLCLRLLDWRDIGE